MVLSVERELSLSGGQRSRLPLLAGSAPVAGALLSWDSSGYVHELVAGEAFAGVCRVSVGKPFAADGEGQVEAMSGLFDMLSPAAIAGVGLVDVAAGTSIYASDEATLTATSLGNTRIGAVAGIQGGRVKIAAATHEAASSVADGTGLSQAQVDARVALGVTTAEAYAGAVIAAHLAASDAHGDRAYADAAIAAAIAALPPASGGDSTQFKMRRTVQNVNVAGFGDGVIDSVLQAPVVAGTYLVESEILFSDAPYVPNIACDAADPAGSGQWAYGYALGPDEVQLGTAPANSDPSVRPIAPTFVSWAGTGQGNAFPRTVGQMGRIRMAALIVVTGAGTIAVMHGNQLAPGNTVNVITGSWLKVTKIG